WSSCSCQVSGHCGGRDADGLLRHLAGHRTHAARGLPARRDGKPSAGAGLRHQRSGNDHADLRHRRRPGGTGGRAGRAHAAGQPANGIEPDHRGVRRGGDRRHGIDPGLHPHRPGAGTDRGPDQGFLLAGLEHRGVRDHGASAAGAAGGTVRQGEMSSAQKFRLAGYALLLAAGLVAPLVVYPVFLMNALCFALFACAFNLLLGYTGLLSFGHAAFFGTAAYITGYAAKVMGVSTGLAILAGTAGAVLLGIIFGGLSIRRQGIYFAMITLALSQLVFFVYLQASFTGGEDGLQAIPRGRLLWVINLEKDLTLYYVVFAIFLFGFLLIHRTIHSPFGQVMKAIRENEPRALSLGYDVNKYKLQAFVISAALSGLAGATYAIVFTFVTLTSADWHTSGDVVLMTLLGGMGTDFGPIVGAFAVVTLQSKLADKVGSLVTVIMGGMFIVCVLLFRNGVVGELSGLYYRVVGKRPD